MESFAAQFRPETRLPGYLDSCTPAAGALASFRERAADLGYKLAELSDLLLAEAGGTLGYIITFDQSRGKLADLIDDMQDLFGFEHYTRYSRIGLLRQGETFDAFYRRFMAELERRLSATILAAAAPDEWKQIEITVQQISLLHRHHEFVADAKGSLKTKLPEGTIFTKVLKTTPSGEVLQSAA